MKMQEKYITQSGKYSFGDDYYLKFHFNKNWIDNCIIEIGNNCKAECGSECYIKCKNNCIINLSSICHVECGNNCKVNCGWKCYIKGGEGTELNSTGNFLKTISKGEEFIWWYIDLYGDLVNTYEDKTWKKENFDKWNELYSFVHHELDLATLF